MSSRGILAIAALALILASACREVESGAKRGAPPQQGAVSVAVVGNLFHPSDFAYEGLDPALAQRDLLVGFGDGLKVPAEKTPMGWQVSEMRSERLTTLGVDAVSLAAPHSMDGGWEGVANTLAWLGGMSIASVGVGHGVGEAQQGVILPRKGIAIALLGFQDLGDEGAKGSETLKTENFAAWHDQAGWAPLRPDALHEGVLYARSRANVVVVLCHWAGEDPAVDADQRRLAREAIDAGADAVIGRRANTPQGVEIYRGAPIVYSVGDFAFLERRARGDRKTPGKPNHGWVAELSIVHARVVELTLTALVEQDSSQPPVVGDDAFLQSALVAGRPMLAPTDAAAGMGEAEFIIRDSRATLSLPGSREPRP